MVRLNRVNVKTESVCVNYLLCICFRFSFIHVVGDIFTTIDDAKCTYLHRDKLVTREPISYNVKGTLHKMEFFVLRIQENSEGQNAGGGGQGGKRGHILNI